MDLVSRLNSLIGKNGLVKIPGTEVKFTFLSVTPPANVETEGTEEDFEKLMNRTLFEIRFDDGILIDGSNTKTISGSYISRIFKTSD